MLKEILIQIQSGHAHNAATLCDHPNASKLNSMWKKLQLPTATKNLKTKYQKLCSKTLIDLAPYTIIYLAVEVDLKSTFFPVYLETEFGLIPLTGRDIMNLHSQFSHLAKIVTYYK